MALRINLYPGIRGLKPRYPGVDLSRGKASTLGLSKSSIVPPGQQQDLRCFMASHAPDFVGQAMALAKTLSPEASARNIRIASLLASWGIDDLIIAAAHLIGIDPEKIKNPHLKSTLDAFYVLESFDCDYADKTRIKYLGKLLVQASSQLGDYELLQLLAAVDYTDLTQAAEVSEGQAQRAYHITSAFLATFGKEMESGELKDLALLRLDPTKYAMLQEARSVRYGGRDLQLKKLAQLAKEIGRVLSNAGLSHRIEYRVKHFASEAEKADRGRSNHDINGLRIILEPGTVGECYQAYVLMKRYLEDAPETGELWEEVAGFHRDYIATPKASGYQTLQTTFGDTSSWQLEVQIRTEEMHRRAEEYGAASHVSYKGGLAAEIWQIELRLDAEAKEMRACGETIVYAGEDQAKPKLAKLITIDPNKQPTPLDAAFSISLNTGYHATGAFINGKRATLSTPLKAGDRVRIITKKSGEPILRGRLDLASTSLARAVIRAALLGRVDPSKELEESRLKVAGESVWKTYLKGVETEITAPYQSHFSKKPKLHFSLARLYKRLGYADYYVFMLVLGMLGKEANIFERIKTRLSSNMTLCNLVGRGPRTTVELMTANKPGVTNRLLKLTEESGLAVESLKLETLPGQEFCFITMEIGSASSDQSDERPGGYISFSERILAWQTDLEDLYKGLHDYQPEYGKRIQLTAAIVQPTNQSAAELIAAISGAGANIVGINIPKAGSSKKTVYTFEVQVPKKMGVLVKGRDQRIRSRQSVEEMFLGTLKNELAGNRSITLSLVS